jgi:hypothetical protein
MKSLPLPSPSVAYKHRRIPWQNVIDLAVNGERVAFLAFSVDCLLSGVQVIFVRVCRDIKVIRRIAVSMNPYGAIDDVELTAQLNLPNPFLLLSPNVHRHKVAGRVGSRHN